MLHFPRLGPRHSAKCCWIIHPWALHRMNAEKKDTKAELCLKFYQKYLDNTALGLYGQRICHFQGLVTRGVNWVCCSWEGGCVPSESLSCLYNFYNTMWYWAVLMQQKNRQLKWNFTPTKQKSETNKQTTRKRKYTHFACISKSLCA